METTPLSTGSIIGIVVLLFLFLLKLAILTGQLIKRARKRSQQDFVKRIDDDYTNHLFL